MESDKRIARAVGSLLLISMTASLLYTNFYSSFLTAPLDALHPNKNQIILGAFLELINCMAVVGIAVMLFSVLKRINEHLARWYFGFRIIESTILTIGIIGGILLITLSQEFVKAGTPENSYFQTLNILALTGKHLALQMGIIICSLGGLMLTFLLYQSRLIPRFISAWGFIGYVLVLTSALLDIFGIIDTAHGNGIVMYLPGGLFETILLPLWLIIKGFNSSSVVSNSGLAIRAANIS